jgi:hypothetical protein
MVNAKSMCRRPIMAGSGLVLDWTSVLESVCMFGLKLGGWGRTGGWSFLGEGMGDHFSSIACFRVVGGRGCLGWSGLRVEICAGMMVVVGIRGEDLHRDNG